MAAEDGESIVSGGARGVDETAMLGALEVEGTVIGILANGLLRACSSAKYRRHLWALQRFYERREERFLELIWPQVGEVHDLDMVINGRRGSIYTKQKPLTLETAGAAFKNK